MARAIRNRLLITPLNNDSFERKYIMAGNAKIYVAPMDNDLENTEHIYKVYKTPEVTFDNFDIKEGDIIICHHMILDDESCPKFHDGQNLVKLIDVRKALAKVSENGALTPLGDKILCERVKVKRSLSELAVDSSDYLSNCIARVVLDVKKRFRKGQYIHFYKMHDYPLSSYKYKAYTFLEMESINAVINNIDLYTEDTKEIKFI